MPSRARWQCLVMRAGLQRGGGGSGQRVWGLAAPNELAVGSGRVHGVCVTQRDSQRGVSETCQDQETEAS
ncbi:hypothetical protein NQZ68_002594 [Dissostichus eleginoides]|nr:hypothetical protein NQZ68_002594 [Dissostichus eleginoides]